MSNNNEEGNNDATPDGDEETQGIDRDINQQRTPRQRLLAKGKGDIIASSTRGPPKNDGKESGHGGESGTSDADDETKTLLWTTCQKFRLHFIKANKLYKINICRRVINHLLEDKQGSFWLKLPTASNDSTAEPMYVVLDAESHLLLDHIRNVLDHIVFLSRLASGFKERTSPSKKSSSSISSRRRTKTRAVTNKSAKSPTSSRERSSTNAKESNHSKNNAIVPDEVASSPSTSASSPSSPSVRDRMGRGRRVRRPPQWKKLDGSDSDEEEEEEGEKEYNVASAAANQKRSRPDDISSTSKATTSNATTAVSSNKRRRSKSTDANKAAAKNRGNSTWSKDENAFSATSSCSGSASSKSGGREEDKKMVPGSTAAKKTSRPPVKSTLLQMQSKVRLQQPSTDSTNHNKRKEGEKRSSASKKTAPSSKPRRRRLYHPPTIPICWERMTSTPLAKSSDGRHGSESHREESSYKNETAMSKAMIHYVSVFGHAQIPPGWIGNVPLAHWASLQRQVMREWVHNYRKPTPQDYERLKPFLLLQDRSIHGDSNEKEGNRKHDEKDGNDDDDDNNDDSMLPTVAAINTVMLWDGIIGSKVPHEQEEEGEEEDKGFPLPVSLAMKGKDDGCSDSHPLDQKMPASSSYTPKPTTLAHPPLNDAIRNGTSNNLPGMALVPPTSTAHQYRYAMDMEEEEDALVI
jgi:hypothetical protein